MRLLPEESESDDGGALQHGEVPKEISFLSWPIKADREEDESFAAVVTGIGVPAFSELRSFSFPATLTGLSSTPL